MRKVIAVVAVIILALLYSSVFVVQQYERGIILRFAKVVRDAENKPVVYEPGLHFKIPFIENVKTGCAYSNYEYPARPLLIR